jgi:hypothetical protein
MWPLLYWNRATCGAGGFDLGWQEGCRAIHAFAGMDRRETFSP